MNNAVNFILGGVCMGAIGGNVLDLAFDASAKKLMRIGLQIAGCATQVVSLCALSSGLVQSGYSVMNSYSIAGASLLIGNYVQYLISIGNRSQTIKMMNVG